jgi:hypothetical protein
VTQPPLLLATIRIMDVPRYRDGQEIRVGDEIRWDDLAGTVVFVIDTRSYSPEFPDADWSYLRRGFMLDVERGVGLVHLEEADEDLELIARTESV